MGHSDAWSYSPRQMSAFLFIAHKRHIRRRIDDLRLLHLATKGKATMINEQVAQWQRVS